MVKNKKSIFGIIFLIGLLVIVRYYEQIIFYDPFINFFKYEFQDKILPEYNLNKLFLNLFFRYSINTVISISIIYLLFKDKTTIKITAILYVVFFFILSILFLIVLKFYNDHLLLFYLRRFLIQPIFLILFIPAFYYQKINK